MLTRWQMIVVCIFGALGLVMGISLASSAMPGDAAVAAQTTPACAPTTATSPDTKTCR